MDAAEAEELLSSVSGVTSELKGTPATSHAWPGTAEDADKEEEEEEGAAGTSSTQPPPPPQALVPPPLPAIPSPPPLTDDAHDHVYIFSYGSNSTTQLAQRLGRDGPHAFHVAAGVLEDHTRVFAGYSKRWGGAVASVHAETGGRVYGLVVRITRRELEMLDGYEWGYTKRELPVVLVGQRAVQAPSCHGGHDASIPEVVLVRQTPAQHAAHNPSNSQVVLVGQRAVQAPSHHGGHDASTPEVVMVGPSTMGDAVVSQQGAANGAVASQIRMTTRSATAAGQQGSIISPAPSPLVAPIQAAPQFISAASTPTCLQCLVYVKDDHAYTHLPSEAYMQAIRRMLDDRPQHHQHHHHQHHNQHQQQQQEAEQQQQQQQQGVRRRRSRILVRGVRAGRVHTYGSWDPAEGFLIKGEVE